jgi:N-acetylneuraminic acid mutarotase
MDSGQSIVIQGMVYYGGGLASAGKDCYLYCYNPHQDQWTSLPQLTVKRFGLGQMFGKPVVIGGSKKDNSPSNEVSVYCAAERFYKWRKYFPMPTARSFPTVVSHQSYVIVAGGIVGGEYVHAVEIFVMAYEQWVICERIPVPCYNMSAVVIQDKCYLLGGFNNNGTLNHVFCVAISDIVNSGLSHTRSISSVWKRFPETPACGPMATVIAGSLFILGGDETCTQTATQERIHVYSPSSNSWVYVNDLPAPRIDATVTALSSTEILVIGGRESKDIGTVNTVYKGVVQIVT